MGFLQLLLVCFCVLASCKSPGVDAELRFVPGEITVGIKKDYPINRIFEFINSSGIVAESVYYSSYTSTFPSDSLQFIKNILETKSYLIDGMGWGPGVELQPLTNNILVSPKMFKMENTVNQVDWLETMRILKLVELWNQAGEAGSILRLRVPIGTENTWVERFKKLSFIEWIERNESPMYIPVTSK